MCGISGAVGSIDPEVEAAVARMHGALVHRGPDADGVWSWRDGERGVILAHRRLAILDVSAAANQPMLDAERRLALVFNGEIYNYRELARELRAGGRTFLESSDTAVLLAALRVHGEAATTRLRGMFAFAAWDFERRELLLARDRLGIKPLYTAPVRRGAGEVLLFASELRALLASGLVPRRLDPRGLSTYLWNGFVYGAQTLVAGVTLLEAGTTMRVGLEVERGVEQRRYWQLSAPAPRTERARVAEVLEETVGQHLASDVPLGVFLSGGVDSSAIACIASRRARGPLATFNVAFEESEFDESPYARAVAKQLGTEHHEILLTEADFRGGLEDALGSIDQPTFDAVNTWYVSRAVRAAGITVALAGTGGDELFGGYASFVDLPRLARAGRWLGQLPSFVLDGITRSACRAKLGAPGVVGPQVRWGKLGDALRTRGDMTAVYQVSYGLFTSEFLAQLRDGIPSEGTAYGMPEATFRELEVELRGLAPREQVARLELRAFLGERLLRDTDAASMDVSLEVRVPFLDHVLIEAVSGLEEELRFDPPRKKQLLRELGLQGLDPAIFDRPKSGFVLPIERWCKRELRPRLEAVFADAQLARDVGLDAAAVQRLWRAFSDGAPGIYWSRVWALYVLLRWCAEHGVKAA